MVVKFIDNFGASYENVGHKQSKWNPQERSVTLDILQQSKMLYDTPCKTK